MKLLDVVKMAGDVGGGRLPKLLIFNTNLGRGLVNHLLKGGCGKIKYMQISKQMCFNTPEVTNEEDSH